MGERSLDLQQAWLLIRKPDRSHMNANGEFSPVICCQLSQRLNGGGVALSKKESGIGELL
jgi:hypothetical protein